MTNDNGQIIDQTRDILAEIAAQTREDLAELMKHIPLETVKSEAEALPKGDFPFEKALQKEGMSFICEVKKASPSKGLIAPNFPYLDIAKDYEKAGASAISCLTEPHYFEGCDSYLQEMSELVSIPLLRKDFFVHEYMVYEAKILGASAVLLICALLSEKELKHFFAIAESLGLSAIFEAHDEKEVKTALSCGARIIGVNNRNLKTFALDLNTSINLRKLVPETVLFISESGIKTREDVALLESHGVDAVLIGESFMRSPNKKEHLEKLRGAT